MSSVRLSIPGIHPSSATIEALVAQYGNRVYQLAYRLTGSRTDAEDVLQEVFFKLFRNWALLSTRTNLAAWITRVVTNASIDLLRSRKCRGRSVGEEPLGIVPARSERPGQRMETEETREKIEEALAALPPRQLAALILFDHEGLKAKEIASILEISETAVRGYVFAARRKVKDVLTPYLRGNER